MNFLSPKRLNTSQSVLESNMSLPDPKDFKLNASIQTHSGSSVASAVLNDEEVLKQMQKEIYNLDPSLETFNHKPYEGECLRIVPFWVFEEASIKALEMFRKMAVWDEKNQTMIILIFNYEGKLISYKRRRFRGGKWITRKATHPNRQCIMRISNKQGPVYIIEGHHDALSATLLYQDTIDAFNFIMIPTVNYTTFCDAELEALSGRDVFFLPDLGDQEKSIKGMTKLAEQVEPLANHVKVANLQKFLQENGIKSENDKLDLSETLFLWNKGMSAFINALQCFCSRGLDLDDAK